MNYRNSAFVVSLLILSCNLLLSAPTTAQTGLVQDKSALWTQGRQDNGDWYFVVPVVVYENLLTLDRRIKNFKTPSALGVKLNAQEWASMKFIAQRASNDHGMLEFFINSVIENNYGYVNQHGHVEAFKFAAWLIDHCPNIKSIPLSTLNVAAKAGNQMMELLHACEKKCVIEDSDKEFFRTTLKCTIPHDIIWRHLKRTMNASLDGSIAIAELVEFIDDCIIESKGKAAQFVQWLIQVSPGINRIPASTVAAAQSVGGSMMQCLHATGKPFA